MKSFQEALREKGLYGSKEKRVRGENTMHEALKNAGLVPESPLVERQSERLWKEEEEHELAAMLWLPPNPARTNYRVVERALRIEFEKNPSRLAVIASYARERYHHRPEELERVLMMIGQLQAAVSKLDTTSRAERHGMISIYRAPLAGLSGTLVYCGYLTPPLNSHAQDKS